MCISARLFPTPLSLMDGAQGCAFPLSPRPLSLLDGAQGCAFPLYGSPPLSRLWIELMNFSLFLPCMDRAQGCAPPFHLWIGLKGVHFRSLAPHPLSLLTTDRAQGCAFLIRRLSSQRNQIPDSQTAKSAFASHFLMFFYQECITRDDSGSHIFCSLVPHLFLAYG